MNRIPLYFLLLTCFLLFFMVACEQSNSPNQSMSDVVGLLPNFEKIGGADNVDAVVNIDYAQGQFSVELSNIAPGSIITDGEYEGWCMQIDKTISAGTQLNGLQIFSTKNDDKFKYINYLINKKNSYLSQYNGGSWKEIQVAMWVILETKNFDLNKILQKLPSSVNGFNDDIVKKILADVKLNGWKFVYKFGHKFICYMDNDDKQDIGLVCEETAYAYYPENSKCFTNISGLASNNWGWSIGKLDNGEYKFDLYAGAGQCDLSKGTTVGTVEVKYLNGTVTVKYKMLSGYAMSETHLYVGSTDTPLKNGNKTVAPGQYPYKHENLNNVTKDEYVINGLSGKIYIIAHAVVCLELNDVPQ